MTTWDLVFRYIVKHQLLLYIIIIGVAAGPACRTNNAKLLKIPEMNLGKIDAFVEIMRM